MFAKKYRYVVHINRGEYKAVNFLLQALIRGGLRPKSLVVNICDSGATTGSHRKGRSSSYFLNQENRKRSALEGAFSIKIVLPWASTHWQPADIGTRPDADGNLPLPRPVFLSACLIIEVFAGSARFTSAARACDLE